MRKLALFIVVLLAVFTLIRAYTSSIENGAGADISRFEYPDIK